MNGQSLAIRVECYAGHRSAETLLRFHLGERKVEILDVVDRRLGPDHRYFKVKGDDGGTYIVRYHVPSDRWELTIFCAG
ncbi:MAG: hypothetical protein HY322_15485 [Betaproteobacteria bacterium]|nr:hypothetical protein [Betaproteobacteria bacterium]